MLTKGSLEILFFLSTRELPSVFKSVAVDVVSCLYRDLLYLCFTPLAPLGPHTLAGVVMVLH